MTNKNYIAAGVLSNALSYLKGRDIKVRFSYTQEFFTDLGGWVEAQQASGQPELVQITPVASLQDLIDNPEDYPDWSPQHLETLVKSEVYRDDTCIERLKGDEPKNPSC